MKKVVVHPETNSRDLSHNMVRTILRLTLLAAFVGAASADRSLQWAEALEFINAAPTTAPPPPLELVVECLHFIAKAINSIVVSIPGCLSAKLSDMPHRERSARSRKRRRHRTELRCVGFATLRLAYDLVRGVMRDAQASIYILGDYYSSTHTALE